MELESSQMCESQGPGYAAGAVAWVSRKNLMVDAKGKTALQDVQEVRSVGPGEWLDVVNLGQAGEKNSILYVKNIC